VSTIVGTEAQGVGAIGLEDSHGGGPCDLDRAAVPVRHGEWVAAERIREYGKPDPASASWLAATIESGHLHGSSVAEQPVVVNAKLVLEASSEELSYRSSSGLYIGEILRGHVNTASNIALRKALFL